MKHFKFTVVAAIVILALGGAFLLIPDYLRTALIYTTPDIDDYKIFDNRIVRAGDHIPWVEADEYNKTQIPESYLEDFEKYKTIAFLIVKDNHLLHEEYWDDYTADSWSNSFSMAKSVISLLIGIAIDHGDIESVDQKVGDYFDSFKEGKNADLSIRDLLTMSSGLDWDEAYSSAFSVTTKAYYGKNIRELTLDLDVVEDPGKIYSYQSCNTQLLSFIIRKATGMNVSLFASEYLWKPLGAKNDVLWSMDHANGDEKAYCCFNSNARDFARLGQLILNRGMYNGKRVISEKYLSDALRPAAYLNTPEGEKVDFYGYQFWMVKHKGLDIAYARGILGQYIFVIPAKNAVVVRLGHKRDKEYDRHATKDVFVWLDAALDMMNESM